MSQSPTKRAPTRDYLRGWALVMTLVREKGMSLSGREANCCFLNTGQDRFANIATVSGLDFIDDARAVSTVDWDKDGDLDLWISNRTAPRVRYMRNDVPKQGNFVAFRLRGTRSNRDGIGARVSVKLPGDASTHMQTLRAGEGFLAQSSKWIHFGVMRHQRIEEVSVRWPDGSVEEYGSVEANRFYMLSQDGSPKEVRFASASPLASSSLKAEPVSATRTVVAPRTDSLTLSLMDEDGEQIRFHATAQQPTLLNLWSETCAPCMVEMAEMKEAREEVSESGLRIIAVRTADPSEDADRAFKQLRVYQDKLKLPFEMMAATAATMTQMTKAQNEFLQIDRPLVLPTSFLLDGQGRISVIYRGQVSVAQVLEDTRRLKRSDPDWNRLSVPFSGNWFQSPFRD